MASKEYKLRMPADVAEATSTNVSAWIDEALAKDSTLAPDPGPGEKIVPLRLDNEKVLKLANARRERPFVCLRRLIATRCNILAPKEELTAGQVAAQVAPDVLPRKSAFIPEDFLFPVKVANKTTTGLYRKIYKLKDLAPAETPEVDRELAAAMANSANKRAPQWVIDNADLVKLIAVSFRWGLAQTDQLDRHVREEKAGKTPKLAVVQPMESPATAAAGGEESLADADPTIDAMHEPVQQEGQF